jgi:ElaB/YqjD/DUF883 family membrane-anchored ribosome-binding protein
MVESTGNPSPARESDKYRSSGAGSGQSPVGQEKQWGGTENRGDTGRAGEKVGSWGQTGAKKVEETVEDAKSLAARAKDKAKDWAQTAGDKAKEWAHTAGERVDHARESVGEGLESMGSGLKERGRSASEVVGDKLEAAGHYLREHDFSGMADSMKDVVRRHPMQSVFVGIGLGFVLARAMRRG